MRRSFVPLPSNPPIRGDSRVPPILALVLAVFGCRLAAALVGLGFNSSANLAQGSEPSGLRRHHGADVARGRGRGERRLRCVGGGVALRCCDGGGCCFGLWRRSLGVRLVGALRFRLGSLVFGWLFVGRLVFGRGACWVGGLLSLG